MQTSTPAGTEYTDMPEEKDAQNIGNQIIRDYKNGNYYKENKANLWNVFTDWFNGLFK